MTVLRIILFFVCLWAFWGCEAVLYQSVQKHPSLENCQNYLVKYPKGKHSQTVNELLEMAVFVRAQHADQPLGYTEYLQQYPKGKFALLANEKLAMFALNHAKDMADFELIIEKYPDTLQSKIARKAIADTLAKDKTKNPVLFERFESRSPQDPNSENLRIHILHGQLRRALVHLDLEAIMALQTESLEKVKSSSQNAYSFLQSMKKATRVISECQKRPGHCERLRILAQKAISWNTMEDFHIIRERIFEQGSLQAWQTISSLGQTNDTRAGNLLLELVGSEQIDICWTGAKTLHRWLQNQPKEIAQQWINVNLQRKFHSVNSDEMQQYGVLLLLAGQREKGLNKLQKLARDQVRGLCAGFLALEFGRDFSYSTIGSFLAAAQNKVDFVENAFPKDLNHDSLHTAQLAEREMFTISQVLLTIEDKKAGFAQLKNTVEKVLRGWRLELSKLDPEFKPAMAIDFADEFAKQNAHQKESLMSLLRERDFVSRQITEAICSIEAANETTSKICKAMKVRQ